MRDFWDWHKEAIAFVTSIIVFLIGVTYLMLSMQANALKYNCELDRKPSIKTAAFIADSQYAYDPKGFCEFLKKKMEQE